jgi:hypothetical protein
MFHIMKRSFINDNSAGAFRSIRTMGCPLFAIEPTVNNVGDLSEIAA